jgi:hypothetical protein
MDALQDAGARAATILLDEPVSNSGRLKQVLAEIGEAYPLDLDVSVASGVDGMLYGKEGVISSDSVILDRCVSWVNVTRHCQELMHAHTLKVW